MAYRITEICNGCGACVRLCPVDAIAGEKKALRVIDEALCIECGVCGRICPEESVRDAFGTPCRRIKRSEWKKPRFDESLCMSCNICIDACPVGCLTLAKSRRKNDPHAKPTLKNERACISCGFCAEDCPVDAIAMAQPIPLPDTGKS